MTHDLNSQTPSDGCMFVTTPFMCRVVSVHRLNTATCSWLMRTMSCSSVSEVKTANSPEWCACMSCVFELLYQCSHRYLDKLS